MPVAVVLVSILCGTGDAAWLVRTDTPHVLLAATTVESLGGPFFRVHGIDSATLRREPGVRWVVREQRRRISLDQVTVDPSEPLEWHLFNDGTRSDLWPGIKAGADIGVRAAWTVTEGSASIVVAVLDNGFPADHPDLRADRRLPGWDFVDNEPDPLPASTDPAAAHGTAVAGLILAARNGVGVVGVCPNCSLLPLRVLADDATARDGDLIAALLWASARADVVNCSWSFDPYAYVSPAFQDAVRWAATQGRGGRGTTLVFSAGNRSEPIKPYAPAALLETLSAGATDDTDTRAYYSNYGASLLLMAPGGVPDEYEGSVRVPRGKIVTADLEGDAGNNPRTDDLMAPGIAHDLAVTAAFYGTSASAPQVAGAAALLLSYAPTLQAAEVRWILTETAAKVGPVAYDSRGRNDFYGYGRVDVGAAMSLLVAGTYCHVTPEVCDNGVDDDCDRLTDAQDPDCGAPEPASFDLPLGLRCDDTTGCGDGYCAAAEGQDLTRFCTADCDYDCPADGACIGVAGRGRCVLTCQDSTGCADGTSCALPDAGLVPPGQDRLPVCLLLCDSDADCKAAFCHDGTCSTASEPSELIEPEPPSGCTCATSSAGAVGLWAILLLARRRRTST